jgi:hypothetical protein
MGTAEKKKGKPSIAKVCNEVGHKGRTDIS